MYPGPWAEVKPDTEAVVNTVDGISMNWSQLPRLPTDKLYKRLLEDKYWAEDDA